MQVGGCQGLEGGAVGSDGQWARVSFWGDDDILGLDGGHSCITW